MCNGYIVCNIPMATSLITCVFCSRSFAKTATEAVLHARALSEWVEGLRWYVHTCDVRKCLRVCARESV